MNAAANMNASRPANIRWLGAGLAAAVLVGVGMVLSIPDTPTQPLPTMAEHAISLPGGEFFFVQKYELSVAEWNACYVHGGCKLELRARAGQDPATTPATGLSFADVSEYLTWFNTASGHHFRLPTIAEWNHMAADVMPDEPEPIFTDPSLTWASSYLTEGLAPRALRPQGSFSTSPEGIVDLDGSVWEWTQECFAGTAGPMDPSRCPAFFVGGEHVAAVPYLVRDPARGGCAVGTPPAHLGMRLVSDTKVES
ncbi:MAG: formylglycine-generating enzyme family protein [Paracoccaceae bacterium]